MFCREITGLINGRIQAGKGKQLITRGETVDDSNLSQDHSPIDVSDTGNGHDDRIDAFHDICHFRFHLINLAIQ